ncbi:MAG: ClpX C4-type zinc finger [Gaiellaceae bacterium]|nr:ClpX C4-type zinc finger [Gaiellaceae bacterium]
MSSGAPLSVACSLCGKARGEVSGIVAGPTPAIAICNECGYAFYRSSVKPWIAVTTYGKANSAGTPFVKEPKFAVDVRGGDFTRMSIFGGPDGTEFQKGVTDGGAVGAVPLRTQHSADAGRKRVRWDHGTTDTDETNPCTPFCFNVVMRSYRAANGRISPGGRTYTWEGGGYGLDKWAVDSDSRAKAYPRDTGGDGVVSSCSEDRLELDGQPGTSAYEASKSSETAQPSHDPNREWEHGGYKSNGVYVDGFTFFHGWEDGRGPYDCEPLQRAMGSPGTTYATFASYSIDGGWTLQ